MLHSCLAETVSLGYNEIQEMDRWCLRLSKRLPCLHRDECQEQGVQMFHLRMYNMVQDMLTKNQARTCGGVGQEDLLSFFPRAVQGLMPTANVLMWLQPRY